MNPQLLLIKCIAALYLRSKCKEENDDVIEMTTAIAEQFTGKSNTNADSDSGNILDGLIDTLEGLACEKDDLVALDIKQTIKIQTKGELDVEDFVSPYLIETEDAEEYRRLYTSVTRDIRSHERESRLKKDIYNLKRELDFEVRPGETYRWIDKASELLAEHRGVETNGHARGVITAVSFEDIDSVRAVIDQGNDLVNGRFVLKTGWRFFNDATGVQGGVRGQTYLYNALSHNGKSYVGSNLIHQFATLNVPAMLDENKKPAIVVVSTEDTLFKYFYGLYKTIMERRLGRPFESTDPKDSESITKVLYEEFESQGYTFHFRHVDSSFNRQGLFEETDKIRAEGYEIHALLVDYFEMFDRSGSTLREEEAIQKDYNHIKSKYRHEHTLVLLPHQASTDVQYMKSDGVERLAAKMAEGGFFKGCRGLHREADFMFSVNKVVGADGCVYFEFGFGKNKINDTVAEVHKYAVRKVEAYGGIWLDYNLAESLTLRCVDTGMSEEMSTTIF